MISCSRSYLALVQREGVVVLNQVRPRALIFLKLLEYWKHWRFPPLAHDEEKTPGWTCNRTWGRGHPRELESGQVRPASQGSCPRADNPWSKFNLQTCFESISKSLTLVQQTALPVDRLFDHRLHRKGTSLCLSRRSGDRPASTGLGTLWGSRKVRETAWSILPGRTDN